MESPDHRAERLFKDHGIIPVSPPKTTALILSIAGLDSAFQLPIPAERRLVYLGVSRPAFQAFHQGGELEAIEWAELRYQYDAIHHQASFLGGEDSFAESFRLVMELDARGQALWNEQGTSGYNLPVLRQFLRQHGHTVALPDKCETSTTLARLWLATATVNLPISLH